MKGVESEAKYQVSPEDFENLKQVSSIKLLKEQLNVYYDYESRLRSAAITLRIRYTKDDCSCLTLKIPQGYSGTVRKALEFQAPTPSRFAKKVFEVSKDLPKPIRSQLEPFGISQLERIGWMRTRRWLVLLPCGEEAELDAVVLPSGEKFFEVEIERAEHESHDKAIDFVKRVAHSARPSTISKFQRFCGALRFTAEPLSA